MSRSTECPRDSSRFPNIKLSVRLRDRLEAGRILRANTKLDCATKECAMLNEGAPNPGRFRAIYPLWTLCNELLERQRRIGSKGGIVLVSAPNIEAALPIFTDSDLAMRFIEAVGWPNVKLMGLERREELLAVVGHFQRARKIQQVAIDISFDPPGAQLFVPTGKFFEDIRDV